MAKRTPWAISALLACLVTLACTGAAHATLRSEFVFFEGTQYPLTAIFIQGEAPGPTVMIQGGIQGDEPTGFLSAQVLSQSRVLRGNLILVPRANVPSIHAHQRAVNVDMNRRFDRDYNQFYEDRLARAVRFLLSQSSALIHLHEGSGFYDPNYISPMRNPMRYGQSIIIDTLTYERLDLERLVNGALKEINAQVGKPEYDFKLFNTRTFDPESRYAAEMRKSLTFYALSMLNIPAMAVEVSKSIGDLGWKVKQQAQVTAILLKHLGVDIILPRIDENEVQKTFSRDLKVKVNGKVLDSGATIPLTPGGAIKAEAAPQGKGDTHGAVLALFASDRPNVNLVDSPRMALESFQGRELRQDGRKVLASGVHFNGAMPPPLPPGPPVFVCWLNGKPVQVKNGEAIRAVVGDQLIIEGVLGSPWKETINFKGYTARPWANDGQDMGFEIILDPDSFIAKYQQDSPMPGATRYQVDRETVGARPAKFFVDIEQRKVQTLRLVDAQGQQVTVRWASGGEIHLPPGEYAVAEAASNGPSSRLLPFVGSRPLKPGEKFRVEADKPVLFTLRQATTFAGLGAMTLVPKAAKASERPQRLSATPDAPRLY